MAHEERERERGSGDDCDELSLGQCFDFLFFRAWRSNGVLRIGDPFRVPRQQYVVASDLQPFSSDPKTRSLTLWAYLLHSEDSREKMFACDRVKSSTLPCTGIFGFATHSNHKTTGITVPPKSQQSGNTVYLRRVASIHNSFIHTHTHNQLFYRTLRIWEEEWIHCL